MLQWDDGRVGYLELPGDEHYYLSPTLSDGVFQMIDQLEGEMTEEDLSNSFGS